MINLACELGPGKRSEDTRLHEKQKARKQRLSGNPGTRAFLQAMGNSIPPKNHSPRLDSGLPNRQLYPAFEQPSQVLARGCSKLIIFSHT